jgi:hypothetical protein
MARGVAMIVGAVGTLLAMELALQCLPVSSATARDYYIDPVVLSSPPRHRWHTATGWDLRNAQTLRANNLGFASDVDFTPDDNAIALIGDSYVEASMLPGADRPGRQLARALRTGRPVYDFGAPGSALLDYAERIRLASTRLAVRDFVILMEAGDVRQSLCGSGNVHGPCLDRVTLEPRVETVSPPSSAKRWISRSALAQYLVSQLKLDVHRLPSQLFEDTAPAPAGRHDDAVAATSSSRAEPMPRGVHEAMVNRVATAFFDRLQGLAIRRLVVVVDGWRRPHEPEPGNDWSDISIERELFMQIARGKGAIVIDAEPLYREHWRHSSLSLDVGPYDGHMNALGVKLVTRAMAEALQ